MSLKEYARKRDFEKSREPGATAPNSGGGDSRFVIQKHDASRLHYDFRLELDGVLKSWAVPKGLPLKKGEKHLAVQVEDHPIAYIDFEGIIPQGQYGGGTVMVWDQGTFEALSKAPGKDLAHGKLHFVLHGKKLQGQWYLVRFREGDQWLIIKGGEDMKPLSKKLQETSALSGKTLKELARSERVWQSVPTADPPSAGKRTKPARAAPLPDFIAPMMAKVVSTPPPGNWLYEIKFDGWRAIALKGGNQARLLSRNEKDLGAKFPEIAESIAALDAESAVIDGEIVALDEEGRSSFQLLQAYDLGETRPPIFYYAFDLLQLNSETLCALPVAERKERLERLLKVPPGVIRYSAFLGTGAGLLLQQAKKLGLEGLIGKKDGSRYEPGKRGGAWIKLKIQQQQEFVIGGYTDPSGTRSHFGAILVGYYMDKELMFAAKVGTGFDEKLLRSLLEQFQKIRRDTPPFVNVPEARGGKWGTGLTASEMKRCHWVEPVMVCQIKFAEWTRDAHLRQPVFLGLRRDKNPQGVVRETAE